MESAGIAKPIITTILKQTATVTAIIREATEIVEIFTIKVSSLKLHLHSKHLMSKSSRDVV